MIRTIEWTDEGVVMIDQRRLPSDELYPVFKTHEAVAKAIEDMVIRGAPAIGVAAAMGIALGMNNSSATSPDEFERDFHLVCERLSVTRPTAVNLFWAVERMRWAFKHGRREGASIDELKKLLIAEALDIHREDIESNQRMGSFGAELIPDNATVLTHCNAGALATAGFGTALGVIRAAVEAGKRVRVYADETRPFLQGARLTAWELAERQHSGDADHRQHGRAHLKVGRGRLRHSRGGSDRRQWRCREQDRHLHGCDCGAREQYSVLCRRAAFDR